MEKASSSLSIPIPPCRFAFLANDLTYTWSDQWMLRFDDSRVFSGGSSFLVGKHTTVGDARLVPGNVYELNFMVEYVGDDPIEVGLVVETKGQSFSKMETVVYKSPKSGLICLTTPTFEAGEAYEAIRFFMSSTDFVVKRGLSVYAVIPKAASDLERSMWEVTHHH